MARTDTLGNFLTDVASAIKTKKGSQNTIQASNFDTEIANLPSGVNLDDYIESEITSSSSSAPGWMTLIKKFPDDLQLDTELTSAPYAFNYYINDIDFRDYTDFDTSNITDFSNFFSGYKGTELNISTFTFNTDSISNMFNTAQSLTKIVFPSSPTIICNNYYQAFLRCSVITEIDLSNFENNDTTNVNVSSMFQGCNALQKIDIRNLVLKNLSTQLNYRNMLSSVPTNCLIIVKDNDNKSWFNTNFSSYTNVKTVAEYENEN